MSRLNLSKKFRRALFYSYLLFAVGYLLSGCATVPQKEALSTYSINGVAYVPLVNLCQARGIAWDYDGIARTIVLSRGEHKINLMLGDTLALVDGRPVHLKYAPDLYQGALVVPYKFKEEVIDSLFKGGVAPQRARVPLARIKKVVIDAGHGGKDPGAIGRSGSQEKDITLDIAKRLRNLLALEGVEVVMTRSTDRFVTLESRADIANNSKADLFLSIHANANRVRGLNGFEVYYISPYIDDSKRALSTAREADLDLDSSCFGASSLNLKAILWDMIYTYDRAQSLGLANHICRSISRDMDVRVLGIKAGRYYVLKGVRMPAVLIETGFLSNSGEERMLRNSLYRQKLAEAIAGSLSDYDRDLVLARKN
jgi:N-acetylmuramoyl-L-alanine amidase